ADADAGGHSVELLLPARALVHVAGERRRTVDRLRRADDRLHRAAAPHGNRGVQLSLAAGGPDTPSGESRRNTAAVVRARRAAARRRAGISGDRRGGDLQLQLLDSFGRLDAELELPEAPG